MVEKSGSWFSYKGERIGQGRENVRQFLRDNPDVRNRIDVELRRTLGLNKGEEPGAVDGAAQPVTTPIDTGKQAAARGR